MSSVLVKKRARRGGASVAGDSPKDSVARGNLPCLSCSPSEKMQAQEAVTLFYSGEVWGRRHGKQCPSFTGERCVDSNPQPATSVLYHWTISTNLFVLMWKSWAFSFHDLHQRTLIIVVAINEAVC